MSATTTQKLAAERRRSERKANIGKAYIASPTATDPSDRIEVTGVNISRHGIAFSVGISLPDGAFFVIDVMMGTQKMNAEIQVVNCRKNGERYQVGAEFC